MPGEVRIVGVVCQEDLPLTLRGNTDPPTPTSTLELYIIHQRPKLLLEIVRSCNM